MKQVRVMFKEDLPGIAIDEECGRKGFRALGGLVLPLLGEGGADDGQENQQGNENGSQDKMVLNAHSGLSRIVKPAGEAFPKNLLRDLFRLGAAVKAL